MGSSRSRVVGGPPNSDGLVGRVAEMQLVSSFLDRAAVAGGSLLIVGDAGVGKTAVLNVAADSAVAAGIRVLRGEGVEFEADLPFSGIHQILLPLLGELDGLTGLHRDALTSALGLDVGTMPGRLVVSNAALRLLQQAAEVCPLLVLVDDLQWLDRSSADVVSFVARRVSGSRIAFLAAARSGTETFLEYGRLPRHELSPLDDAAASDLLRAQLPTLSPRIRAHVLAEAQGNPLALLELPAALSRRPGFPECPWPPVPRLSDRVQALFAARIGTLSPTTRALVLLAVLDGTSELGVLRVASGDVELSALTPAEEAGLLQVDEGTGRLLFRHPLTQTAVMGLSTRDERRRAHLALADALRDQPLRRAWHLAEATVEPEEEVATSLESAAREALRRGDSHGAVTAMLRAAELSPARRHRGRRLAQAAYVGRMSGDLRDVRWLLAEAEQADPGSSESLEAAVAASYVLRNIHGDLDTAHRLLVSAIEMRADRSECEPVDTVVAHALHTLKSLCFTAGRPELWEPFDALMARLGRAIPEALAACTRLSTDPARASRPDVVRLDAAVGSLHGVVDPMDVDIIGQAAIALDRVGGCREALWETVEHGRESRGNASPQPLIILALDDFFTGRWDEADELVDELLGLYLERGYGHVWVAQYIRALLAASRGDVIQTRALADDISRWAEPRRLHGVRRTCCHALALAASAEGDFEHAYQLATTIGPPGTLAVRNPTALWVAMDLVEAAAHTGRHTEAAAHVAAMREEGIAALSPRLALLTGASAAIVASDPDEAVELFDTALALRGVDRWRFDLARVQLAYGARLRRARARIQARRHLTTALDTFRSLGANPWVQRAGGELRATGLTRARTERLHPTRLTPQERQIAILAAEGMTNKQIGERLALSHRTVASHLHRIFPKAGIATRSALRGALADMQADALEDHATDGPAERRKISLIPTPRTRVIGPNE